MRHWQRRVACGQRAAEPARWIGGVVPQNPVSGALLVFLECVLALTVTFMFGTWFSTLTSGVITLGLLGVAFLGGPPHALHQRRAARNYESFTQ